MTNDEVRTKIEHALVEAGMVSHSELARRVCKTPQSIHRKMHKKALTVDDLNLICDAIDYHWTLTLTNKRTGEAI